MGFKKRGENKKGQVTVFVIIGILIVAGVVLFFLLRPETEFSKEKATKDPEAYIKKCIRPELEKTVKKISSQGGSLNPSSSINYNNTEIAYLCYTNQNYEPCVVQYPLIHSHVEKEIEEGVKDDVKKCFNQLEEAYRDKGYQVNLKRGTPEFKLLPKRIFVDLRGYKMSVSRDGESQSYKNFKLNSHNNLYEMVGIAKNIIEFEYTYGDANAESYMSLYHDLKVEKDRLYDGTTIYKLTDRNTGKQFKFASRSMPLP